MAKIIISNFLSVVDAQIELGRMTVFIGPQAQGKSLVLKLIHFFETAVNRSIIDVVTGGISVSTLKKESLERFETYFPKYSWGTAAFSVTYISESFEIKISRLGGRRNNPATLSLGAALEETLKSVHMTYRAAYESIDVSTRSRALARRNLISDVLDQTAQLDRFRAESVFIPASRSFFANIEKNIFTLISSKFELDLLMAEFGTMLEETRRNLLAFETVGLRRGGRKHEELRRTEWSHIINGDYVYDGDDESIEVAGRKVKISNSSSGQQEAIPMLLVLDFFSGEDAYSFGRSRGARGASFFVEEPEAHLFPKAQRAIAMMLTEVMNRNSANRIVFTTHSPYMLTAVNNLSLAGRLYGQLPEPQRSQVLKTASLQHLLAAGDLHAYKVDGGRVESIIDGRSGLVNGMLIDEVSMEFARDFDDLLSLKSAARSGAA